MGCVHLAKFLIFMMDSFWKLRVLMFLGMLLCFGIKADDEIQIISVPTNANATGNVTGLSKALFSTEAYEREALRLIVKEANQAATELQLPEKLPITEKDLARVFITKYGMTENYPRVIGNIHTHDYGYFVSVDHKLSFIEGVDQDGDSIKWMAEYQWPVERIDTNSAFNLATQWLTAVHMDVEALNKECLIRISTEAAISKGKSRSKMFVPIYTVSWRSPEKRTRTFGNVASVKLFTPTKTLMSLRVLDSKYILRAPLIFTNLNVLLSIPRER
jgi:hypothetical protein